MIIINVCTLNLMVKIIVYGTVYIGSIPLEYFI